MLESQANSVRISPLKELSSFPTALKRSASCRWASATRFWSFRIWRISQYVCQHLLSHHHNVTGTLDRLVLPMDPIFPHDPYAAARLSLEVQFDSVKALLHLRICSALAARSHQRLDRSVPISSCKLNFDSALATSNS